MEAKIKDMIKSLESELEVLEASKEKLEREKATTLAETILTGGEKDEVVKDIDHRLEAISRQIGNNTAALPVLTQKLAQAEKAIRVAEMAKKGIEYFTAQSNMFVVASETVKLLERASSDLEKLALAANEFKQLEVKSLSLYDELFHFMDKEAVGELNAEVTKDSLIATRLEAKKRALEVKDFANKVLELQWKNHLKMAVGLFTPSVKMTCYQDPRVEPLEDKPAAEFSYSMTEAINQVTSIGDKPAVVSDVPG